MSPAFTVPHDRAQGSILPPLPFHNRQWPTHQLPPALSQIPLHTSQMLWAAWATWSPPTAPQSPRALPDCPGQTPQLLAHLPLSAVQEDGPRHTVDPSLSLSGLSCKSDEAQAAPNTQGADSGVPTSAQSIAGFLAFPPGSVFSFQFFLFVSFSEQCFRTVNLSGNVRVGKK